MLQIGSVVDGKYRVLREVGHGGMSVVYQAVNEKANKIWAIKEVRKDGVQNYEIVKQNLIVETELLKRFNHPNLPSIIDVIDEEDSFLIVMDYIEGNSLSKALEENGAQNQDDVVEWAKQLCDVLGYLHSRRPPIIYRDMKPGNIMLKPDGNISLIDFGTAREFKSASVEDTTCLGTQGYAAPEQYGGHGQTDARTDIYCLGATMYHLVTGHNPSCPPYEMYPIRQWNPNLSSGLEEIIIKCTQRNPKDRYQNCAELLYALEHYHDLDIENRKAQDFKWKTFLASGIIAIVFIVAALGFKVGSALTSDSVFWSMIDSVPVSASVETKMDGYGKAIWKFPERMEGYQKLLEAAYADKVLSEDEYNTINTIITKTPEGRTKECKVILQETDRNRYANEFAYNLANYCLFCYGEAQTDFADLSGTGHAQDWYKETISNTSDSKIKDNATKRMEFASLSSSQNDDNPGEKIGTGDEEEDKTKIEKMKDLMVSLENEDNIFFMLKGYNLIASLLADSTPEELGASQNDVFTLKNEILSNVEKIKSNEKYIKQQNNGTSIYEQLVDNIGKQLDKLNNINTSDNIIDEEAK